MQIKEIFSLNNDNNYSIISKSFHWLRFLLLILIYYGAFTNKFLAYFLIFLISVHGIVIMFNKIVRKTDELKRMM